MLLLGFGQQAAGSDSSKLATVLRGRSNSSARIKTFCPTRIWPAYVNDTCADTIFLITTRLLVAVNKTTRSHILFLRFSVVPWSDRVDGKWGGEWGAIGGRGFPKSKRQGYKISRLILRDLA